MDDKYLIRPKKTTYKGVVFKSRLEAMWASEFDLLGLQWEYEPMCYLQNEKSIYTPDFLLKTGTVRHFVEVKPTLEHFSKSDKKRVFDFCQSVLTEFDVFSLYVGGPQNRTGFVLYHFGVPMNLQIDTKCTSFCVASIPSEHTESFLLDSDILENRNSEIALTIRVVYMERQTVFVFHKFFGIPNSIVPLLEKYGEIEIYP